MSLYKRERMAIIKSLMFIIAADDKLDPNENLFMANLIQTWNENAEIIEDSTIQISEEDMINIISNLTDDEKIYVKVLWLQVANCDGKFVTEEQIMIRTLATECRIKM